VEKYLFFDHLFFWFCSFFAFVFALIGRSAPVSRDDGTVSASDAALCTHSPHLLNGKWLELFRYNKMTESLTSGIWLDYVM